MTVGRLIRIPAELGRPSAILSDGCIITRPPRGQGGAVRLFSREGTELDAKLVRPYSEVDKKTFEGATVLNFRSGATGDGDVLSARVGDTELAWLHPPLPNGYSIATRSFFSSMGDGSQLHELTSNGTTPRWGSTIGLGMQFGALSSFAFHPTTDRVGVSFGSFQDPRGWHSRVGVHVPGANGLEFALIPSPSPRSAIEYVFWVGEDAWWVARDGGIYAWCGDGRPRSAWDRSLVAVELLCKLPHAVTRVERCGAGLIAGGDGRLSMVGPDGSARDALGQHPMSHEHAWFSLGERYATVRNEKARNDVLIRNSDGFLAGRVSVKPNEWPDVFALDDGSIAFCSAATSYVDIAFVSLGGSDEGDLAKPSVAEDTVLVLAAAQPPRSSPHSDRAASTPSSQPVLTIARPLPVGLSPDWYRLKSSNRTLPFSFRPEHPASFEVADFALFAAANPVAARRIFDPTLLDCFDYSWKSLAGQTGGIPQYVDFAWGQSLDKAEWISQEFRNWGGLLSALWTTSFDREPLLFKLWPLFMRDWGIPRTHWLLPDGTPKVYSLREIVLRERVIAVPDADVDDPWDVYPSLSAPYPNLGPQFEADEGYVALLPPGWGFREGQSSHFGEGHDELARQRAMAAE